MAIRISGGVASLEGDWTLTRVTSNIESVARSLQQLDPGSEQKLRVDCGLMEEADVGGLQLLNIWMQCARFRGMELTLVNVPERLQHAMHVLVGYHIIDTCLDAALMTG